MATSKVKGTNRKIKELKGIKPEKITDKQLEKLQNTIDDINRTQLEVGSIETRKHVMLHNIAGLRDQLTLLQDEFEKDYGTFDVDIKTGIINYSKENGEVNKKD
tara:strand:- start:13 stop:324 length:312 start_codon:yes stop_codon:yes gene_type:complete